MVALNLLGQFSNSRVKQALNPLLTAQSSKGKRFGSPSQGMLSNEHKIHVLSVPSQVSNASFCSQGLHTQLQRQLVTEGIHQLAMAKLSANQDATWKALLPIAFHCFTLSHLC